MIKTVIACQPLSLEQLKPLRRMYRLEFRRTYYSAVCAAGTDPCMSRCHRSRSHRPCGRGSRRRLVGAPGQGWLAPLRLRRPPLERFHFMQGWLSHLRPVAELSSAGKLRCSPPRPLPIARASTTPLLHLLFISAWRKRSTRDPDVLGRSATSTPSARSGASLPTQHAPEELVHGGRLITLAAPAASAGCGPAEPPPLITGRV